MGSRRPHRGRRIRGLPSLAGLFGLAGLVLTTLASAGPVIGAQLWTLSADTLTVQEDEPATITLRATNAGGGGRGDAIGCIRITWPASFTPISVTVDADGKSWNATLAATSTTLVAATEADVLYGGGERERADIAITGTATAAGLMTWTGGAWTGRSCSGGLYLPQALVFTVTPAILATPLPSLLASLLPSVSTLPPLLPTPTPTRPPSPTPTPTRPPSTPAPTPSPSARPSASIGPSPSAVGPATLAPPPPSTTRPPTPTPSASPVAAGPLGSQPPDRGLLIPRRPAGDFSVAPIDGVRWTDGFVWAVPALTLSVPGILLIVVILAQGIAGVAWLPFVRRRIRNPEGAAADRRR